ncbi:Putative transposase of IS4/5 family [Nitrosospira multiformis]|uniref:Putative transposase of IS4/5 family n=1 Tax=Nitrosospira multiformis TaxID=1231 RepID=A0A1H8KVC1_9PROT|nr:Putative transposase of IS4/5 family [Nitrosospira multiformis]
MSHFRPIDRKTAIFCRHQLRNGCWRITGAIYCRGVDGLDLRRLEQAYGPGQRGVSPFDCWFMATPRVYFPAARLSGRPVIRWCSGSLRGAAIRITPQHVVSWAHREDRSPPQSRGTGTAGLGGAGALLEPHLPGRKGVWGGIAEDNPRFIGAVFWILRTGAPWRDLPPEYGGMEQHAPPFHMLAR